MRERRKADRRVSPSAAPVFTQQPHASAPSTVSRVLELQQSAGNAAVARTLWPIILSAEARSVTIPGLVLCKGAAEEPLLDTEHHWIEIGEESFGWWPSQRPDNLVTAKVLFAAGVPGILNGTSLGIGGSANRDPRHGSPARRVPLVGSTSTYGSMDSATAGRAAAATIRRFAHGFSANYSWNPFGTDCQEFVQLALDEADMSERASFGPASASDDTLA